MYFWMVAREGGLVAAANLLRLSHPTLSAQIHALEAYLGEKLFVKVGRKLVLTDTGRMAFRYADEIFSLGREMLDTIDGRVVGPRLKLHVGVVDVVPKLIVRQLLSPVLLLAEPPKIVCLEDSYEKLLAELSLYAVDVVIADAPVPPGSPVRAFSHLLGETAMSFFCTPTLARSFKKNFPKSLNGAPMLLPLESSTLGRTLAHWFQVHGVKPNIVAEFQDSALLKVFGAEGRGIFVAPTAVAKEVCRQYGVVVLGSSAELKERYYAISVERRLKNSGVLAICESARRVMFAPE